MSRCIAITTLLGFTPAALPTTVTLAPSADTTLFEAFPTNNLGASDLTSGSTLAGDRSRTLIRFNLEDVLPADAAITSAAVILTVIRQPPGGSTSNYRLFRVLRPWNEGDETGVHGAPASPGETTWNDRLAYEPGGAWSIAGAAAPADYFPDPSAQASIDNTGFLPFNSSSNLVRDLQFWLTNRASNNGWILVSDAEDLPQTVTHFGSREDPTNAPALVISYASPAEAAPRITDLILSSNRLHFAFTALAQRSYTVQYALSLPQTNWQTLLTLPAPLGDTNITISDPLSPPARFFRIEAR